MSLIYATRMVSKLQANVDRLKILRTPDNILRLPFLKKLLDLFSVVRVRILLPDTALVWALAPTVGEVA